MRKYFKWILILFFPFCLIGQTSEKAVYKALDETFDQLAKGPDQTPFINGYENFIYQYPNSAFEDEALFRLSQLYALKQDIPQQLFTLIKLKFLHTGSPLLFKVDLIIDSLLLYDLSLISPGENDLAITELNYINKTDNYIQSYVQFLSFIHYSNINIFHSLFVDEASRFIAIYNAQAPNLDAVIFWRAEIYRKMAKPALAVIDFKTILNLNLSSGFASSAMFQLAQLYNQLDKKEKAQSYLIELINQFPEDTITGNAQYELAMLYETQFGDTNEAFTNYQMLVETFPENKNYVAALFKIGDISFRLNDPNGAVESYKRIIESSQKQEEIINAYQEILKVQLEIMGDLEQAVQTHLLIAQSFPNTPEAAEHLLSAAKIYHINLNNDKLSKELLQILIDEYGDTPEGEKAKNLLNRLQE